MADLVLPPINTQFASQQALNRNFQLIEDYVNAAQGAATGDIDLGNTYSVINMKQGTGLFDAVTNEQLNRAVGNTQTTVSYADFRADMFRVGIEIPPSTTELTLTADPGIIQNTWVFIDGQYLEKEHYSLYNNVITLDSSIPLDTVQVEVCHGQAIPIAALVATAEEHLPAAPGQTEFTFTTLLPSAAAIYGDGFRLFEGESYTLFGATGIKLNDPNFDFESISAIQVESADMVPLNEAVQAARQSELNAKMWADLSESYAQAAAISSEIYKTVPEGLAGTTDGTLFAVLATPTEDFADWYENDDSINAIYISTQPASATLTLVNIARDEAVQAAAIAVAAAERAGEDFGYIIQMVERLEVVTTEPSIKYVSPGDADITLNPNPTHGEVCAFVDRYDEFSVPATQLLIKGNVEGDPDGLLIDMAGAVVELTFDEDAVAGLVTGYWRLSSEAPRAALPTVIPPVAEGAYPVGSVYINALNSTDPEFLLGFGEWQRMQDGQVLIPYSQNPSDFNYPLGNTGGTWSHNHNVSVDQDQVEFTGLHALTVAEIPEHEHWTPIDSKNNWDADPGIIMPEKRNNVGEDANADQIADQVSSKTGGGLGHRHTVDIELSGQTSASDTYIPFLVVSMWMRIA